MLLNDRCRGSTTLTPSNVTNHNFPSVDLVIPRPPDAEGRLFTPSDVSNTRTLTISSDARFRSIADAHVSNPPRATRTSPHGVFSQRKWSSSSRIHCTASHGNPFLLVRVLMRPFFN